MGIDSNPLKKKLNIVSVVVSANFLKAPRIHCSNKMTNAIDHFLANIIHKKPNFISLQSVKSITCVGQIRKNFEE